MAEQRRTWNEWDVPYFGAARGPAAEAEPRARTIRLFDAGSRVAERIWAVLLGIGALVAGAALTGFLLVASFVLSWLSTPDRGEVVFAIALGAAVAAVGLVLAVLTYIHAGRPMEVRVYLDRLEVSHKTFRKPLVVARTEVRAATIDTSERFAFARGRFPISGALPDDVYADALDNLPAMPWEDFDPERRRSTPGVIWERPTPARSRPNGSTQDDPDLPGWASMGGSTGAWAVPRDAFLWSAHGSSLPFLRLHAREVPNLAMLFAEPIRAPRSHWWLDLIPMPGRITTFRGGRPIRGLLVNVRDLGTAQEAFEGWGVLRGITADDVLDEGLLVAKPLTGYRALIYAAIFLGGIAIDLVFRALR